MRERLLGGFQLGEVRIEPLTGSVERNGVVTHLSSKPIEILLCLAAKPWVAVSHDALLRAVWGETGATPEALHHAIGQLRRALADDPMAPRFIQTLPKRGYRLLVEPVPGRTAVSSAPTRASAAQQRRRTLVADLRRRGVVETAVAYLVSGWLLIQVANVTFAQLALPPWTATFVTYFVIVGFPCALVLAWFIRITPQGAVLDLDPDAIPERKAFGRPYVAILGGLVLASLGVLAYDRYVGLPVAVAGSEAVSEAPEVPEAPVVVDANTIAVLPFLNIGGSDEGQIFSEGLAEDVMNRLARVPELKVAARGDAFSLPPNALSADVRRRLRVAYYLEGSVRLVSDELRVVVRLVDSASGFPIVSRSFAEQPRDFFSIQDAITDLTVANLRVALPAATQAVIEDTSDNASLDAYVLYRRGIEALHEPMTQATIDRALDAFNAALKLDSGYAAAHAGICMTYASGYPVTNDAAYIDHAEASCSDALALNANLDVVHNALGELYLRTGRYEDAEGAFKKALAINPKAVNALLGLGAVYARQQRLAEAEEELGQAIGLQPGNWNAYNVLGGFLYRNGRYGDAADQYREVVSLDDGNMTGWTNLGASLLLSGEFSEAAAAFQHAIEIMPTATAYGNLGMLRYYLGETGAAIEALRHATELAPNDYLGWSNLGDALSFSSTPRDANAAFEQAQKLAEEQLEVNENDAAITYGLAWIKTMLGKPDQADALLSRASPMASGDPYFHYTNALVLAHRGELETALDELEVAAEMGYPRALIAAEPHLRTLENEPRFGALIGRAR